MTLDKLWYSNQKPLWPLLPFSYLYGAIITIRKKLYHWKILKSQKLSVPIIVVGNITVGGTGKTPLVMHLVELIREAGFQPGIISRGYKGNAKEPTLVEERSDLGLVGDEALMLVRRLQCPMAIGKNRFEAARKLIDSYGVDFIISDDGLQHYSLHRDMEIAVIDAKRRFGNRALLPVGPLREPEVRLKTVDIVLFNGKTKEAQQEECLMQYQPGELYPINRVKKQLKLSELAGKTVHAVAGIGHPAQFFELLASYGLTVIPHAYPDHHAFQEKDIVFGDALPVVMTEKDAVKCLPFVDERHWALPITAKVSPVFDKIFLSLLQGLGNG